MISPEDTYPGKTTPANSAYPEGSIKNETVPDSSDDGTPLDELWGNDWEGFKQAVAKAAGIVPTPPGNVPDTAELSQIFKGLTELASGRAVNYDDDSVAADAIILGLRTNQQGVAGLFSTMIVEFTVAITNVGDTTITVPGMGTQNIINTSSPGTLKAGKRVKLRYRLGTDDWVIEGRIPSFRAYLSTQQDNITGTSKIEFDTKTFDTDDDYDVATFRYTPSVAGKYVILTSYTWINTVSGDSISAAIRKSGSDAALNSITVNDTKQTQFALTIVEANGTTDYFEVFGVNTGRDTSDILNGESISYFEAYKISD